MTGPPIVDLPIPSGRLLTNSPQSQSTGKRKRNEQNDSSDETEGPQKRSKMSPGEAHVGGEGGENAGRAVRKEGTRKSIR